MVTITTKEYTNGAYQNIDHLVRIGERFISVDRPCMMRRGWQLFCHDRDGIGLSLNRDDSPFRTMSDAIKAAKAAFGDIKVYKGYWADGAYGYSLD